MQKNQRIFKKTENTQKSTFGIISFKPRSIVRNSKMRINYSLIKNKWDSSFRGIAKVIGYFKGSIKQALPLLVGNYRG